MSKSVSAKGIVPLVYVSSSLQQQEQTNSVLVHREKPDVKKPNEKEREFKKQKHTTHNQQVFEKRVYNFRSY